MKYLKQFESKTQREMINDFIDEVKNFSSELLAYLTDMGCKIKFNQLPFNIGIILDFDGFVRWDDIKQYILPFYEILKDTYYLDKENVVEIKFEIGSGEFNIDTEELMDYRFVTTTMDIRAGLKPLDSIFEIKIKFDHKKVYGKFDYEGLKK